MVSSETSDETNENNKTISQINKFKSAVNVARALNEFRLKIPVENEAIKPSSLKHINATIQRNGNLYNLTLNVPSKNVRRPISFVCLIDVSGSMGFEAARADGDHYFTRLDLVKHVLNVLVAVADPMDYLALVSFTDDTKVVMDLCQMNEENKQIARECVKNLRPEGGTYTFRGLKKSYEVIEKSPNECVRSVILLTDGVDSEGSEILIKSFDSLPKPKGTQLNALGFSNGIDSACLKTLAEMGNGIFGFIPDQTMIGTVFINFLANTFYTFVQNVEINLDENFIFELPKFQNESVSSKLTLFFGQPRHFLIKRKDGAPSKSQPEISISLSEDDVVPIELEEINDNCAFKKQIARNKLIKYLNKPKLIDIPELAETYKLLNLPQFESEFEQLGEYDPNNEQLKLALKYEHTWGAHYLRSVFFAHLFEQCANFKSPSMQIYREKSVEKLIEELTDVFCSLPPPEPSGKGNDEDDRYGGNSSGGGGGSGGVNFSSLMNSSNFCILETCKIKTESGAYKCLSELKKNDILYGGAKIVCVIKMKCSGPLIRLNKLFITPFHPIMYNGKWIFPIDVITNDEFKKDNSLKVSFIDKIDNSYVYNMILDKNHIVDIEGVKCITLGHMKEEGILKHEYLGTRNVIENLSKFDGWDSGFIYLDNYKVLRNSTGLMCGISVETN